MGVNVHLYYINDLHTYGSIACSSLRMAAIVDAMFQVLAVQQKEDRLKKQAKDLQAERDQVYVLTAGITLRPRKCRHCGNLAGAVAL